jgi:ubiquinone/menaquinone biosynthesis C-methylase UbiE
MHSAVRYYDLLAEVLTLGRERALRTRIADIAAVAPGESVLDVGCGTGSLALVAKRRVGSAGSVSGVDASSEMIDRARTKARKAGLDVAFEVGLAEALPAPGASVDVVFSTLMMHHLPPIVRDRLAAEIRRVLAPGGRVLVVDFEAPARRRGGLIARFHRHGGVPLARIVELLENADLPVVETGALGVADLQYALAQAPIPGATRDDATPVRRTFTALPMSRPLLAAAITAAIAVHLLVLHAASPLLIGGLGAASALAAMHLVAVSVARSQLSRRARA